MKPTTRVRGRAEWDGGVKIVPVLLTRSDEILIGTGFLKGYRVELDYEAGTVRIAPIPQPGQD